MKMTVWGLVVILGYFPGCFSDGKYWWMGSGGAFGDGADNNKNDYQQIDSGNNFQGIKVKSKSKMSIIIHSGYGMGR